MKDKESIITTFLVNSYPLILPATGRARKDLIDKIEGARVMVKHEGRYLVGRFFKHIPEGMMDNPPEVRCDDICCTFLEEFNQEAYYLEYSRIRMISREQIRFT